VKFFDFTIKVMEFDMLAIFIRRFIGGLMFAIGFFMLSDAIGFSGCVGVSLIVLGTQVVVNSKFLFLSVSQEFKSKQLDSAKA